MPAMRIQALVVEEKDARFVEQELELEEPARGEALMRIVAAGVCHTDQITRHATCRCRSRPCSGTRVPASWSGSVRA